MDEKEPVLAAGAVVWREADHHGVEVLLVHRPRYDDWSFPKGKLDPDEHLLSAAVREVAEETGLSVRLGPALPRQEYPVAGTPKHVFYWAARPVDDSDVSGYEPNREIDAVTWVPLEQARTRLTYARDVDILDAFAQCPYASEPLVVLRHARAMARSEWSGPDAERRLAAVGESQARDLVPLLQAFGVRRVLTSDAVRCTATVRPYAAKAGLSPEVDERLSEEGAQASPPTALMSSLMDGTGAVVVCSHRPVLPLLFDALGVQDPSLRPGAFVVVHRTEGRALATEQHLPS